MTPAGLGARPLGGGPPTALLRSLLDGPSAVQGFEWHDEVTSTNALALEAGRAGAPEIHVVAADVQTAGRGRRGRTWQAPPGTSLMCSWLLRPPEGARVDLVPLMAGLALAQVAAPYCPGVDVALKWPNDLLVAGGKCAGILVEHPGPGLVVCGTGLNVDWRGVQRPDELSGATSLAEARQAAPDSALRGGAASPGGAASRGGTALRGGPALGVGSALRGGPDPDRWRVFAGLAGVMTRRYAQLLSAPDALVADFRAECATVGRQVRVTLARGGAVEGQATAIGADGSLVVQGADGRSTTVHAGDVEHLRDH